MFKLVGNRETTLVLSFCHTESCSDKRQRDRSEDSERESLSTEFSSEEENIEGESNEDDCSSMESSYSSYSPYHKQSVTFTLPPDYERIRYLCLPRPFLRENGINKPVEMYLLGKDGKKWLTNLLLHNKGTMKMGMGWKDFVKANGLETSFTLKLIWENTTPVLSLCPEESTSDRGGGEGGCSQANQKKSRPVESLSAKLSSEEGNIEGESSEEEWNSVESSMEIEEKKCSPKRKSYSSYLPCHKRFVTFTLPPDYDRIGKLCLPVPFVRENSINKPGVIYLMGKDGTKWRINLNQDKKGTMSLGKAWKDFFKANGLETGFTLKLIWEDTTPVLSLCCAESTNDREQEEYFKAIKKQSLFIDPSSRDKISRDENNKEESRSWKRNRNHLSGRDSTPPSQKQFVRLTITPSSFLQCRLNLPSKFARENGINKPGMIYLLGQDGTKWLTNLHQDKKGAMSLGKGWKDFVKANKILLKSGESFTVELIWEDADPMIKLVCTEPSSSKANEKEPVSTEPRSRDPSPAIQHRFVTLTLTPEDVRACKLILPSQFMKANGMNKLGKITLLGENEMERSAYLLTKYGLVALGNGWDEFCEANGVKIGDSFTLEFISEQEETPPVLKFCSLETNRHKKC